MPASAGSVAVEACMDQRQLCYSGPAGLGLRLALLQSGARLLLCRNGHSCCGGARVRTGIGRMALSISRCHIRVVVRVIMRSAAWVRDQASVAMFFLVRSKEREKCIASAS